MGRARKGKRGQRIAGANEIGGTHDHETKARKAPAVKAADPIFAMIAEHKRLEKEWLRLSNELDLAEAEARKKYGAQPLDLIEWRNYSAIGEYGIDKAREEFLSLPGADRDKVEAEYQDAKRRFAARGMNASLGLSHRRRLLTRAI